MIYLGINSSEYTGYDMILGQSYATCFLACAKLTDIHD